MLPKVVWNIGLIALTAALTVVLAGPMLRGPHDNEYQLTIKKQTDGTYYFDPKPSRFYLKFHGQVRWDILNSSPDQITFAMDEFKRYAGDCPLDFLGNTGNTQLCRGEVLLAPNESKPIKAKRHRSNPSANEVFDFKTKVNGTSIDPDIELERDPYGLILYLAIAGGIVSILVGWWLGRKR